ncbi:MAG TPA: hypothetical protein VKY40_10620 [Halanaerobiales bacterium]|nr:hypothetical protein [Halanaerobiales bacterium]
MKKMGLLVLTIALIVFGTTAVFSAEESGEFTVKINVMEFLRVDVPDEIVLTVEDPTQDDGISDNVTVLANFEGATIIVSSNGFDDDLDNVNYLVNEETVVPGSENTTLNNTINAGSTTIPFEVKWNGIEDNSWTDIEANTTITDTVTITVSN